MRFFALINISLSERVSSYPLREVKGLHILRKNNKAGELELRKYVEGAVTVFNFG